MPNLTYIPWTWRLTDGGLAVNVYSNGAFNIGIVSDASTSPITYSPLTFDFPGDPWSSYTTINVDSSFFSYNKGYGITGTLVSAPMWSPTPVEYSGPISVVPSTNTCTFLDSTNFVEWTQTITLTHNQVIIVDRLTNIDIYAHDIGLRKMYDATVDGWDNSPFIVGGVQSEAYQNLFPPPSSFGVVGKAWPSGHSFTALVTGLGYPPPDDLQLANWNWLYSNVWGATSPPDPNGDSAYALFWNPVTIAPNDYVEYASAISIP